MIDDFVKGHPAEHHPRPLDTLRAAHLGEAAVARLIVATHRGRVVGMAQWFVIYDAFWAMYGVHAEWLYVRPELRGLGIAAALVAEVCACGRRAGAEFLKGGGTEEVARLYERVAIGNPSRECHVSAEAFQVFADLAGRPIRELVRQLPTPELSRVTPRARGG